MRWVDLAPDPRFLRALDYAGSRPEDGNQNEKRRWSEKLAHACAVALAEEFNQSSLRGKRIRPESLETGTEPLTPLGSGTSKRIDVTVADPVLGLEIGASLKGLNFKDGSSGNFDKNLTGRLYELGDEVRLVHEHLPHAFMVGVFFLPLESVRDKTERAASSFAHTVVKLRERTGRLDAALHSHAARCDLSFVALYTTGSEDERLSGGIVRFFDTRQAPPKRGRPRIQDTLSMSEVVETVVSMATFSAGLSWGKSEDDL